jgi:serine/threonine protein kinase
VVSELLCGETLRDKLASGSLPVRTAINYATGAARGLIAAHDVGVIHRDLKPENLFITVDDRVKILDFGLARCRRALLGAGRREPVSTHGGTIPGTAGYMSPEQVRGEAADQRSDIFALGAILHEMISGAPPFRALTSVETIHAILEDDPAPLSGRGDVSPELARIVRHCLEKSPDARFQSARDLGFVLDAAPCTTARPCTRTPRWRTLLHSLAASLQGGVRFAPGRR